jgi:ABC-type phosphate transport system substrate-binding protein
MMNTAWKWILLLCLLTALSAAAAPESLQQSNPLGHQMLSVEDYLHFTPAEESLSGDFVPAYSGTSEAFMKGVLANLQVIHPEGTWDKEFQFDCSSGVLRLLLSGKAELGISSIPMTSAQREAFVRRFGYPILEARVALDALQILVHPSNPVDSLTVPQLDAIYGSELRAGLLNPIRTWEEAGVSGWNVGQPITAFAGWLHYGTSKFFRESVLEGGPWREDIQTLGVIQSPEPDIAADPAAIVFSN